MTDRYSGFVVTLDHDLRADDAEETLTALRMVRGVISVTPVVADLIERQIGAERLRSWFIQGLLALIADNKAATHKPRTADAP